MDPFIFVHNDLTWKQFLTFRKIPSGCNVGKKNIPKVGVSLPSVLFASVSTGFTVTLSEVEFKC